MKISSKGRYALLMLVDLAEHWNSGYISLKEISERQNISKKYLEQIIPILHQSDILRTNRGSQGGYMLARDPSRYTVGDILRLTEGSLSPVEYDDSSYADSGSAANAAMVPVWQGLSRVINEYLDSITLQDLIDRQRELYANDYII